MNIEKQGYKKYSISRRTSNDINVKMLYIDYTKIEATNDFKQYYNSFVDCYKSRYGKTII